MILTTLIFIIIIILLVIFIILGAFYYLQWGRLAPPPVPPDAKDDPYADLATWSKGTPIDDERGGCHGYTMAAGKIGTRFFPGTPTLDPDILDQISPEDEFSCLFPDQINAKKMTHKCQGDAGSTSWCWRTNGTLAQPGDIEIYYESCPSQQPKRCPGDLAALSVGIFQKNEKDVPCVQSNGDAAPLTIQNTCDLTKENQLYVVLRPAAQTASLFARLTTRDETKCLIPSGSVPSTGPIAGTSVILGECSPNSGFVWGLIPPLQLSKSTSPQQFGYIGHISTDILLDPNNYKTTATIAKMLQDNNVMTMLRQSANNSNILLEPWATTGFQDKSTCTGSGCQDDQGKSNQKGSFHNSQYLDYQMFNIITGSESFTPFGVFL